MFKTWWRKHTLWGLRTHLAELLQEGEQSASDFEVRLRPYKVLEQQLRAQGYPATARIYITKITMPCDRWQAFWKPLNTPHAIIHMTSVALRNTITRAQELIDELSRPLPDIRDTISVVQEKQLYDDIQHLTIEITELTSAMDALLSATGGISTDPLYLEIGKLKKEGFRLLGVPMRDTMGQLIQHRKKLYDHVQSAQRALLRTQPSPSG